MIQLIHLQKPLIKNSIDINFHSNNTTTTSYDYASTQKNVTFTKNSMIQTIEMSVSDNEVQRISPLVLDLNKDGFISTIAFADSNTYFDITGDGFKERTTWVESDDGLLVLDKNGNGTIDNGTELFGNFTQLADGNSVMNIRYIKIDKEVA